MSGRRIIPAMTTPRTAADGPARRARDPLAGGVRTRRLLAAARRTAAASLLAASALLLPACPAGAGDLYRGQVVSVQDGDTITVQSTDFERLRVRLYGIDCPENRQAFGDEARDYLYGLVHGRAVELDVLDVDRYSRHVALVTLDGELVNSRMAEAGYAWTYERYCKERGPCERIREAERSARGRKAGLWADPSPIPPWEYRGSRRGR